MKIDGHAVERAIKRISKEMGFRLYSEDGLYVLKTGLTMDEPEGIKFRTWRAGRYEMRFIPLETLEAGMDATERAIREMLSDGEDIVVDDTQTSEET